MNTIDDYPDCMWTDLSLLEGFMKTVFVKLGVPGDESAIVAEVLITADKRGIESHGIGRFNPIYGDRIDRGILSPVTRMDVVADRPTPAVFDGNNAMEHVIAKRAMQTAIDKAAEFGMGMVAVRSSSHFGIDGYYVEMCSGQDMIGIAGTNARPSIAPTFGVENILDTNPRTLGFPTDEEFHFTIDCPFPWETR